MVNIYIARSPEVDSVFYREVVSLLQTFPGPIHFLAAESESVTDAEYELQEQKGMVSDLKQEYDAGHAELRGVPWDSLFRECEEIRRAGNIEQNDYLVLLTDRPNSLNWFAGFDELNIRNAFVHTADWEHFIDCDRRFPVAYEVATEHLKARLIERYENIADRTHGEAIGCMMDLCRTKRDISLKLRTGDICVKCVKQLSSIQTTPGEIQQTVAIIEGIRTQMLFRTRMEFEDKISRLKVNRHYQIELSDYGNLVIPLSPLCRALYLFYLRHPEGCTYAGLGDHKDEIIAIYSRFSNAGTREEIRNNITRLVDPRDNSLNEKVSRIKKTFRDKIGPRLSEQYIIKGEQGGQRRIQLDRRLVVYEAQF